MNNRRRARIKALIKECRAKTKDMTTLSAQTLTIWNYREKMGRIAFGDDLADAQLRDFRQLCAGLPDMTAPIWNKRTRFWTRAQGTHTIAIDVIKSARMVDLNEMDMPGCGIEIKYYGPNSPEAARR